MDSSCRALQVRVSKGQFKAVKEHAKAENMSISSYIMFQLFGEDSKRMMIARELEEIAIKNFPVGVEFTIMDINPVVWSSYHPDIRRKVGSLFKRLVKEKGIIENCGVNDRGVLLYCIYNKEGRNDKN